ncbi:endolytic transglycosylase MltG [Methylothermus subterraneus]
MKRAFGLGLLLLVAGGIGGLEFYRYRSALAKPLPNGASVVFEVQPKEPLASVAARLQQQGLIEKAWWLKLLAFQRRSAGKLKAGEYEIEPGTTLEGLWTLFVSGKVKQHKITFVEGWTVGQALAALRAHPAVRFTLEGVPLERLLAELGLPPGHPEGQFFPDTYFFVRGTQDREILRRAWERMQAILATEWARRDPDLPFNTAYEALILASIVEKETGRAEERAQIAGVFVRRLQQNMRLESDPTVIYGMGEKYQGDIRTQDLRADTPYNTYVHAGLPPTPIALPGRAAIHAALHPSLGDALYFVAKGDGSHDFSATFEEHMRKVDRYQRTQ